MHPDVEIADWLSDRYPGEMTVVIQHWFDNLDVTDDGFSITLNFGDNPEPLYIPYDAIQTFVDPSVEFGLRFETQDRATRTRTTATTRRRWTRWPSPRSEERRAGRRGRQPRQFPQVAVAVDLDRCGIAQAAR